MNSTLRLLIAMAVALLCGPQAFADAGPQVRLVAFKVVATASASGVKESLQPLQDMRPGDTIEYEATYVNRTASTARNVLLTVPVPAGGLEYVAAQRAPLATSASADGKSFAPLPLTRVEVSADGKAVLKPLPLADYRLLRWNLGDLPAGASRSVRARMHLPALSAPVAVAPNVSLSNASLSNVSLSNTSLPNASLTNASSSNFPASVSK